MDNRQIIQGIVSHKDIDRFDKTMHITESVLRGRHVERIIDLGCNHGGFTVALKQLTGAEEAWGIDTSQEDLKQAVLKGVKVIKADLNYHRLPFLQDTFDVVFCLEVMYHLYTPDHLLKETRRVLRTEGVLILSLRNLASWTNRMSLLLGFQPYYHDVSLEHSVGKLLARRMGVSRSPAYTGYVRGFTLRAIKELLQIYGFRIVQVVGYREANMPPLGITLDGFFSRFPCLASGLVLASIKEDTDSPKLNPSNREVNQ